MQYTLQHGNYRIEPVSNHVLKCELSGTFNMEGIEAWIRAMKSSIKQHHNEPIGLLIDARLYTGGTVEALEKAEQFHEYLIHTSVVAQAHIISSPTLYQISLHLIPSLKLHAVKSFLRMDDASSWLTEQVETHEKESADKVRHLS